MRFACCNLRRLEVLAQSGTANAIEFLEVLDKEAPPTAPRQQTLFVRLLRPGFVLKPENLRIEGGERIKHIGVVWAAAANSAPPEAEPGLLATVEELARTLVIRTDSRGDYSRYELRIVAGASSDNPPADFDPQLASIEFSFKVECAADFDCEAPLPCLPDVPRTPAIDYLAKDYQGFRRLLLDRLSLLSPSWTERSAADVGMALVETLAFAADTLSYRQDTIANEAYLATARQRVSVRRHARLVDYRMHEGCNARAFVHFDIPLGTSPQLLPERSRLLTQHTGKGPVIAPDSAEERAVLSAGALVFETVHPVTLRDNLSRMSFYTWGDTGCCLPRGATSATLREHATGLAVGDVLIFEEKVSPTTFKEEDADRGHRHAVRLTRVVFGNDPSGKLFDPVSPSNAPLDVTFIEWDAADALPFALCVSITARPGLEVSVALGNNVLAEHGDTVREEPLAAMPPPARPYASIATFVGECCAPPAAPQRPPLRYRPSLRKLPLSHGFDLKALLSAPLQDDNEGWWSVAALRALGAHQATPQVALEGKLGTQIDHWSPQPDLLASKADHPTFVVETQDDGTTRLRFGDDAHGRRPNDGTTFTATYRVGNGTAGNVGAEAIAYLVSGSGVVIETISNRLPAFGGIDAEDVEAVRRDAPQAFRKQERAVTAADYAAAAQRRPDVQRAAASFRWTGSWHTVFVTADRLGGAAVEAPFEAKMRRHLERFRMAGYDLEVDGPRYVPLDVILHLCVKPAYFRSDVVAAVREVLSSRLLPDGRRGIFHADSFSFGEPVYLSRIVAAAQAVEGVDSVRVDRFQRLVDPRPESIETGVIPIGRLEVAQLENDPGFRERGVLQLTAGGGK
jgi:hypothetical protein